MPHMKTFTRWYTDFVVLGAVNIHFLVLSGQSTFSSSCCVSFAWAGILIASLSSTFCGESCLEIFNPLKLCPNARRTITMHWLQTSFASKITQASLHLQYCRLHFWSPCPNTIKLTYRSFCINSESVNMWSCPSYSSFHTLVAWGSINPHMHMSCLHSLSVIRSCPAQVSRSPSSLGCCGITQPIQSGLGSTAEERFSIDGASINSY